MDKYLVGVDVGGTTIKIGQFDLEGNLLLKWDIPTDRTLNGDNILKDIYLSIAEKIDLTMIKGIGFGVPGPVSGTVVLNCVNLGWGTKDVAKEFHQFLNHPEIMIKVSNDANVACAGEVFQGSAKGYRNVVLFTLGTGVGGGILCNGEIVDGYNGVGGELGHMMIDFKHKLPCNCGKKGCLETVASATGIVNLAKLRLKSNRTRSLLRQFDNFSAKRVFDLAKQGDPVSVDVIDEATDYLAYAMSLVTLTVNPELFVIGGGVSNAGDYLIDKLQEHYYKYVNPFILEQKMVIASLGNDAGIFGAAYMVKS